MASSLEQLKLAGSVVVCDSSDVNIIAKHGPQDATTNPSLILAASGKAEYADLIKAAIAYGQETTDDTEDQISASSDYLLVRFGCEILNLIPGRISTEIDANLSFDVNATVNKAREIVEIYHKLGYDKSRVLIKLAGTWEGIKATEILQREQIDCNVTLIFSMVQAIAAAQAGAYIISPFVGRILDWHTATYKRSYSAKDDPGVHSVRSIHAVFKQRGYGTIVMGASFRNIGEIMELAGCDYLTMSPKLLDELAASTEQVTRMKQPAIDDICTKSYIDDEATFRSDFNQNRMAVEKLRDGVSKFAADTNSLTDMLQKEIRRTR